MTGGASHALPAFPGAEGFGTDTPGGRGGTVYVVTNLADSGPGSLRAAIQASGPRVVVFAVGGTIPVSIGNLTIANPYITIAGQTAPGGGIQLRAAPGNDRPTLNIVTHDVVIRHVRFRPGDPGGNAGSVDAVNLGGGAYNVVIDHCSLSWAPDENLDVGGGAHDITVQWSILSEPLNSTGFNSQNALISGAGTHRLSLHHNLFAHAAFRSPESTIDGAIDLRNNVVYNHGHQAAVFENLGTNPGAVNLVGNHFLLGSSLSSGAAASVRLFLQPGSAAWSVYPFGNIGPYRPSDSLPQKQILTCAFVNAGPNPPPCNVNAYVSAGPFPAAPVTTTSAFAALLDVLADAGATRPRRDSVDARITADVSLGTGALISNVSEAGGWPPLPSGVAPTDGDLDGMPDAFEIALGLDPQSTADGPGDADSDGYTNLEEYLNGIAPGDADGDGVADTLDRCPMLPDPSQPDSDSDGVGDACDSCPSHPNADQSDADGDLLGDACDDWCAGDYLETRVDWVSPPAGSQNRWVEIGGTGFRPTTSVWFDGVRATSTYQESFQMGAYAPSFASGHQANVWVSNVEGCRSLDEIPFAYLAESSCGLLGAEAVGVLPLFAALRRWHERRRRDRRAEA